MFFASNEVGGLREGEDRQETESFAQAMNPFARIERSPCMQRLPQSRQSRKGKLLALFGEVSHLAELFLRVGYCENQDGIDRLINGTRCTPTVRFGMELSVPTFFHGSTNVRANSLSGSFSEHPATQHAGLCFRLSSVMSHGVELGVFSQSMARRPRCGTRH